jgi:hypothetical protein
VSENLSREVKRYVGRQRGDLGSEEEDLLKITEMIQNA